MIRYYLRVQTHSPLSITSHQNITGLANPTLPYIPGATLRGALAWQMLNDNPALKKEPIFQSMFDQGGLRCGPLYPIYGDNARQFSPLPIALPIPLTARSCKRKPGFANEPSLAQCGHGVLDTLIAVIEEKARQQGYDPEESATTRRGLAACEACPRCQAPLQRFGGYFEWDQHMEPPQIRKAPQAARLLTRTALLDELESARPGALFSREAVESGQEFAGFLDVDTTLQQTIEALLDSGVRLQIGAGRTAGLGQIVVKELKPDWDPVAEWLGPLQTRWERFQQRLTPTINAHWVLAPITFLTDAILLDRFLRFASAPTPEVLAAYYALEAASPTQSMPPLPDKLTLCQSITSSKRVAGWNTGSQPARPRFDDAAIVAGSVFVLAAPPDQAAALFDLCHWLETNGLGERRTEGFGQLAVALPFHLQGGWL
ncbi:MAG: hypothetical protein DYG89_41385 [Caldilinea sp. CFX5]|nr:hypothetical protein [Caldilinea sp. CFX5]